MTENLNKEPKNEQAVVSAVDAVVNNTPNKKVHFERKNGGYYDAYGNKITTEMLMNHPHEIIEDEGWIDFI